ncbi:response regulator transcription factor [Actinacidiphila guanduensis]|uniref:DNA-binding response regulator, OmpR family, contains REC and winged-helix (WHTH) domain n=1 Tax=Actinacidiphila guanduensis TaxID=310781 RepID=A0A1H0Q2Z6_9ACTN|nr:response regulator transcription factor [Actinacidiphila guanduensis]SDP11777.1 DNA-binding response regulator, OmpR family, contains REC and winged-helix (wHTH) domain [Actinacidiphila guanduensis]
MCAHVLVAEDDVKQAEIIGHYLRREGHTASVVHDGRAALEEIRRSTPDLVVLDVMMPAVDGLDVCRILRRESDIPVLMLTARTTEDDLLLAFDLGADEYMTKPYSPRELMARIRNVLKRRARQTAEGVGTDSAGPGTLRCGAVTVDLRRHTVTVEGRQVTCTAGEFDLLAAMAAAPGQVFSRRQLLAAGHGSAAFITERTIDVHVLNLRKKIEQDPSRPVHLLTVFKVGYKLSDRPTAHAGGGAVRGVG